MRDTLIAVLVPTAVAVIAAFPLIRASKSERDAKLMLTFVELMGRAHALSNRYVGVAEQVAAVAAVSEMGRRHPRTLLSPALWGLKAIDQFFKEEDKAQLISLGDALKALEEFHPRWWQRWS